MTHMFGWIMISVAVFAIVVNIAVTVSHRFRRWLYAKHSQ